ncbi:hypothetical protein Anapl_06195 [Anas platyrhynchos]|uniref:Uncharacterized protein n=1 Tax=Anas platyrhynchos TaxID=8839 RepID=R0LEW2_ANAPL|nr:hypothetical protein Anapl_06195 [Anas platyrhynchos]
MCLSEDLCSTDFLSSVPLLAVEEVGTSPLRASSQRNDAPAAFCCSFYANHRSLDTHFNDSNIVHAGHELESDAALHWIFVFLQLAIFKAEDTKIHPGSNGTTQKERTNNQINSDSLDLVFTRVKVSKRRALWGRNSAGRD